MKNGEVLKEILGIDVNASILDNALEHVSYINEKYETDTEYNICKIESSIGGSLICVCYNLYFLINDTQSVFRISETLRIESIAHQIDERYKIRSLIYLSQGEQGFNKKYYEDVIYRILFKIYTELGFEKVYDILSETFHELKPELNYKSKLQEYVQSKKGTVIYEIVNESGQSHDKIFEVRVRALNKEYVAFGRSKKLAEKEAAKKYMENNHINYESGLIKNQKRTLIIERWAITDNRKKEINKIKRVLELDKINVLDLLIDWAFIHKSYVNENKNIEVIDNSNLIPLGTHTLDLYLSLYLMKNDKYSEDYKEYRESKGQLLKVNFINEQINADFKYLLPFVRTSRGFANKEVITSDVFKSLLAILLLQKYMFNNVTMDLTEKEINKIINRYYFNEISDTHINYTNWMTSFLELLGIDYIFSIINEIGKPSDRTFEGELLVKLSQYGLKDFIITKEGRSKKELRLLLCVEFYKFISLNFSLNNFIARDDEEFNIFLRELLSIILKKKGNFNNNAKVLGGLCLENWDIKNSKNIIRNLRYRQLYNELILLYNTWCNLYQEKLIEINQLFEDEKVQYLVLEEKLDNSNESITDFEVINEKQHLDNYEDKLVLINEDVETDKKMIVVKHILKEEKINNIETKKDLYIDNAALIPASYELNQRDDITVKSDASSLSNKIKEKIEKNATIFTKLYFFNQGKCSFCNSDLEQVSSIIQVESSNKMIFYEIEVCSCSICGIRGVDDDITQRLTKDGFKYQLYLGSPSYYSSTIIYKNNVKILCNSKKKRKRTVSLESLEKQLAIKNEIGKKGELFVLEVEKNNLVKIGRSDLAEKVTLVSEIDCTAGFDIISFFEDGKYKYIEVKSSTSNLNDFYFTVNEYEVAKKLEDSYFIYKVSNLSRNPYINKINNPAKKIEQGELVLTPTQYHVNIK